MSCRSPQAALTFGHSVVNEMQQYIVRPCRSGRPAHFCNTEVDRGYIRLHLVEVVRRQQSFDDIIKNAPSRRLRCEHWDGQRRSMDSRLRCSLSFVRRLVYRRSVRARRSSHDSKLRTFIPRTFIPSPQRICCRNTKTLLCCVIGLLDQVRVAITCSCDILSSGTPDKLDYARGAECWCRVTVAFR
ncbi:hypothetical protein SAMN05216338_100915 [Bradyrhizobium sp. Rc2d]|nr:hypothetical protein SAMN05216338_100915 [Bradyrhizobium sp. Rc2d]